MSGPVSVLPIPLYLPNLPRETVRLDFSEFYTVGGAVAKATELLEALTKARQDLNDALLPAPEPSEGTADPVTLVNEYISLVSGMVPVSSAADSATTTAATEGGSGDLAVEGGDRQRLRQKGSSSGSKKDSEAAAEATAASAASVVPLSQGIAFTWTNFTLQQNNISFGATEFEICSAVMNLGLWYLRIGKEHSMARGEC